MYKTKVLLLGLLIISSITGLFFSGCDSISVDNKPDGTTPAGFWITSYPEGASVYLAPGTIATYDNFELIDTKYLIGKTPLYVNITPGAYLIATSLSSNKLEEMGYEVSYPYSSSGPNANDYFINDGNFVKRVNYDQEKPDRISSIAKVYSISDQDKSIISILIPIDKEDYPLSRPYFYPSFDMVSSIGVSYPVVESDIVSGVIRNINDYNIGTGINDRIVEDMAKVVSRVGKVILYCVGKYQVVVQASSQESKNFMIQIRY